MSENKILVMEVTMGQGFSELIQRRFDAHPRLLAALNDLITATERTRSPKVQDARAGALRLIFTLERS